MTTLRLLPDLEDALRQLPGVRAASVVTGPDAHPTEVHVLAVSGKTPKQVVRDVQSLAMARYDLDIDHRIVSVVQLEELELVETSRAGQPGTDPAGPRPAIAAVTVRTTGLEADAAVTITAGGGLYEGRASGPAAAGHRPRLVAGATLVAVSELLGQMCEVESAALVTVGMRHLAVVVLTLVAPRSGEQALSGSAVVRGDEALAVCRATLNALNRSLAG